MTQIPFPAISDCPKDLVLAERIRAATAIVLSVSTSQTAGMNLWKTAAEFLADQLRLGKPEKDKT